MLSLYFLRHGLADRSAWNGEDFDRPLTESGSKRMRREARFIRQLELGLDRIVTSPLVRARQTAEIVAAAIHLGERVDVDKRLDPGFDTLRLASIVAENAGCTALMFVGHEPSFSEVISELIGGGSVVCKKGALARIDVTKNNPLRGNLVWLVPPRILAGTD